MKIQITLATLLAVCLFSISCADGTKTADAVQESGSAVSDKVPAVQASSVQESQVKVQEDAKAESKAETDADGAWGHLSGTIIVDGDAPQPKEEVIGDHPDKAACLVDGKLPLDDNILVNAENKGLKDVIVMMYLKKKHPESFHPSYAESKNEPVVLDNVKCRFVPHVAFVRTGQKLVMKNSDAVGHNCHITTFNNEINPTISANDETSATFDTDDKIPGKVQCDLHKWMDSVIFIRDNPYVAVTDADGKFTIENLPEGEWEFQFWHSKVGYMKKLAVTNYKTGRKGEVEVAIKAGETVDLGSMSLPAKSFKK